MQYGAEVVYVAFMVLMVWWGRRIAVCQWPFITKLLAMAGIFVFLAIGGNDWQELWFLLWPHWALLFGFVLGIVPQISGGFSLPFGGGSYKRQQKMAEELRRQKEEAEADLRRQEREAAERLRRERDAAEEQLRREAENMRREAEARAKQAEDYARHRRAEAEQEQKSEDDPYTILDLKPGASQAEIKAAYRKLATQYHPDKAAAATEEIQKLAEERFKAIKAAYDALTN